ncbi:MAG: flagellar basal body P-ring formation protein FlgA [Candidatus Coatesbacteria bacterium]|nr:flagellar basal body P-ring formation protein FlgA [Candidatus Coatesbacteria bacterium]
MSIHEITGCYLIIILLSLLIVGIVDAATISEGRVEALVREEILSRTGIDHRDINIDFIRVPEISVPGNKCQLKIEQQNAPRELGRLSFAITAIGEDQQRKYWVTADVSARVMVVCANQALKARSVVGPGDVVLKEREIGRNASNDLVTDVDLVVGKILKRGVTKGRMITSDILVEPFAVKRRSVVRLVAQIKSLRVVTLGEALKDGRIGDVIPVKNTTSKRTVYGTVQEDGTVLVLLGGIR